EAAARLDGYLRDRPLPFYPWLRRLAEERLADVHRGHLRAGRRSVAREEPGGLPAESALALAERLLAVSSRPSAGPRREARRAGRLPAAPRGGPGRHGRRLRGRADLPAAAGGPEGPAVRLGPGRPAVAALPDRSPGRRRPAPHPHRPGPLRRLRARRALLRH